MGNGTKLMITHIATGHSISFSNFALTEFSDSLSVSWNKQEVFGRMDPIMNYQGTSRDISMGIAFKSLGTDAMTARHKEITQLMAFQYPTYSDTDNALAIQSPPLLKVSFANLISSGIENTSEGLVCAMDGCAYTPGMGFTPESSPMIRFGGRKLGGNKSLLKNGKGAVILPKEISLKLKFTVLHHHKLGWHFNGDDYDWQGDDLGSFGPGFMPSKYNTGKNIAPPGSVEKDKELDEEKEP